VGSLNTKHGGSTARAVLKFRTDKSASFDLRKSNPKSNPDLFDDGTDVLCSTLLFLGAVPCFKQWITIQLCGPNYSQLMGVKIPWL
jgi:hypothetical protein